MINRTEVLERLEKIVEAEGENHFAACVYSNAEDGTLATGVAVRPICIAGAIVFELGGEEELLKLKPGTVTEYNNAVVLYRLGLDKEAVATLRIAQFVQDSEASWGTALEYAKAYTYAEEVDVFELEERAEQDRKIREELEGVVE